MLNNKGYSLLEIVVVVLIIAILAGIGLPYYRSTVERTKIITHIATLKALQDAIVQYYPEDTDFPSALRKLHVTLSDSDWTYNGKTINRKDGVCAVTLHDGAADEGNEKISMACKHAGQDDWRLDFHFKVNAGSGVLGSTNKYLIITAADASRRSILTRAARAANWQPAEWDGVYEI